MQRARDDCRGVPEGSLCVIFLTKQVRTQVSLYIFIFLYLFISLLRISALGFRGFRGLPGSKCCYLLHMAARAWPGAAVGSKWPVEPGRSRSWLEMAARARPGTAKYSKSAARVCAGASVAALACSVPPVRSKMLFELASAPPVRSKMLLSLLFKSTFRKC